MIVYLEIPPLRGRFQALAALLPDGQAGWLGDGDVSRCRLVGTDRPLAEAIALLPDARLWTFLLHDPVSALRQRWAAAQADAGDPAHVMANTFNLPEAITLALPELPRNTLARHLSADGGAAEPAAVVAYLETLPLLVGYVQSPFAYAQALEQLLALPAQTIEPFALAPKAAPPGKPGYDQQAELLASDLALAATLFAARGDKRVYRSPPARKAA